MSSRLVKVSRTSKPAAVELHCPACRTLRRCCPVGIATIANRRREVVQCSEASCSLEWIPARSSIPQTTTTAA